MSNINICLACDNNYSKYAGVVIASVLQNAAQNTNISFYIIHDGLLEDCKNKLLSLSSIKECKINFIKVNKETFTDYANIKTNKYLSIATYYRLKIASLLSNVDKVLYFDCDVVINTDLTELYNTNLKNYIIAGVKDICAPYEGYINAGMILFNLAQMRVERIEEQFLSWTQEHAAIISCGDQEIINEVCKGRSLMIEDDTWNVQTSEFYKRSNYTRKPKIIHYIGKYKPWVKYSLNYYKEYFFRYLKITPWKNDKSEFCYFFENLISIIKYPFKKPFFWLNSKYYKALYKTYFLQDGGKLCL